MSFYRERVYPRLVRAFDDPPPIRAIRRKLLTQATGATLEIGVRPRVNFAYYEPAEVKRLFARAAPGSKEAEAAQDVILVVRACLR